ncbi:MAG: ATP-binding protein [Owenweeksia sp.]|nr:ATP-binding protein [Owenweeksia sp.]
MSVRAEERTNDWLFVVEDQGRGISKEDQKKIFMIFETLDDEALRESTGIGLAHCKKIVEMHHGKIWVQSEVGIGSAFYFTVAKELSNNLHGSEQ